MHNRSDDNDASHPLHLYAGASQLRDFAERTGSGILVLDPSGRVRYINSAAERLTGLRAGAMVALGELQPGMEGIVKLAALSRHGADTGVSAHLFPIHLGDEPAFIAALNDQPQSTNHQTLERQNRALAALYETSLSINAQMDPFQLLGDIVERAATLLRTDVGGLFLIDEDGKTLTLKYGFHLPPELRGIRLAMGEDLSGRIAQSGQVLMIADYQQWEGRLSGFDNLPFHRILGAPLKVGQKVIGAVFVSDTEKCGDFSEDDVQLATLFADQAAIAIQNARLFEAEHEQRSLSDALRDTASALTSTLQLDEVLERVLDNVGQVVPHDAVNIMLIKNGAARVVRARGYLERGVQDFMEAVIYNIDSFVTLGQMARTGRYLIIPDAHEFPGWVRFPDTDWVRSFAGAPIRVRGETIGFLELDSDLPDYFTEAHGERLQVFADQVAAAIDNANLFDEIHARAQQLEMIAELATTISRPVDLADVLRAAVSGLGRVLGTEQVGVALFDETRKHLVLAAETNTDPALSAVGLELPLDNNFATQQVVETRAPLSIADAQNDPLMASMREIMVARQVQSILLLPLTVRGEVIGTIGCDLLSQKRDFSREEMQLAMTVANLVAVRIEQARLLASAQLSAEELVVASDILRSLNAHSDLRETYPHLVKGIKALIHCDRISLAQIDENRGEIDLDVLDHPETDPATHMVITTGNTASAVDILSGATHFTPDLKAEIDYPAERILFNAGYRSRINLPLKPGQKVIGSLNLVWMRPEGYANVNIALLNQITDAIGIALERTRLMKETHQRDIILQSLAFANQSLLAAQDLDEAIPAALGRLGEALSVCRVTIFEVATPNNGSLPIQRRFAWHAAGAPELRQEYFYSPDDESHPDTQKFHLDLKDGITRHGLITEMPECVRAILQPDGVRSTAIVPIFFRSEMWGFASFDDCTHDRRWTLAELESLKNGASSMGAALTRRHAENAEREQRRLAEALRDTASALNSTLHYNEVLERILINLEKVVPHDAATIMLMDNDIARIERTKGYLERGLGEYVANWAYPAQSLPNLRQMMLTGQPLCIPDVHEYGNWVPMEAVDWVHSYVGAPIKIKGITVGFLNLDSTTPGFFNNSHAERLRAFADQAAVSIENARLFSETQEHARQTNLLNEITHATVSSADSAEMLTGLVDRLTDLFHADTAHIVLCEQNCLPPTGLPVEQAELIDAVLTAGKILVAEDSENPSYIDPLISPRLFDRSLMGLPLTANGKYLGVVLIGFHRPHPYTPDEIALGDQAAGQIALAIARVKLLEAERQRTAQLSRANSLITALGGVAARIETAPDPDSVLETLGAELRTLGVHCLVGIKVPGEPAITIRYLSLDTHTLSLAEKLSGLRWRDYRFSAERFPAYQQVVVEKRAAFTDDPFPLGGKVLPHLPSPLLKYIFRLAGITNNVRAISLPLTAEEQVMGVLWLWGEDLQESDLPAVSLFASQVAIALENARLYSEVQQLAITDDLTGLYNRRGLMELGRREVERALRFDRPLSAVMIDLDLFKLVNDQYGHFVGDQVLRALSARCKEGIREVDVFGRFGGEEFVILLVENDLASAVIVAERLRETIAAAPFATSAGLLNITASFGVSAIDRNITDLHTLIDTADQALYRAKQSGRNRTDTLLH